MGFRNLVDVLEKRNSSDNKGITFIYGEQKEKFISYHDLYSPPSSPGPRHSTHRRS